ncbi:protein of unknown function [Kyrpidia spormannii]|uniref:Uncharacterized protein n=1 Tax=Kyrpidia spormannii TaxID=2055160 RepID=A0ACA8ZDY5_9BACL|nr:protein of unknown function [Kyrpidia spormannii]
MRDMGEIKILAGGVSPGAKPLRRLRRCSHRKGRFDAHQSPGFRADTVQGLKEPGQPGPGGDADNPHVDLVGIPTNAVCKNALLSQGGYFIGIDVHRRENVGGLNAPKVSENVLPDMARTDHTDVHGAPPPRDEVLPVYERRAARRVDVCGRGENRATALDRGRFVLRTSAIPLW